MDLHRTYPCDEFFKKSSTLKSMKNILLAYSRRNVSIGYCQGFNFIVGRILKILRNEEDSFWLFVQLVECILPLSYYSELAGIIVDTSILHILLKTYQKELYQHLTSLGYNYSLNNILYKWFVSLFIQNTNEEISFIIWDCLFLGGSAILFYASLAIFSMLQIEITKIESIEDLHLLFDDQVTHVCEKDLIYYYCLLKPKKLNITERFLETHRVLFDKDVVSSIVQGNSKRIELLKMAKRQASYVKGMVICQRDWPMCIYDLTYKYNNILTCLVLRVGEKIIFIEDYFFNQCYKRPYRSKSIEYDDTSLMEYLKDSDENNYNNYNNDNDGTISNDKINQSLSKEKTCECIELRSNVYKGSANNIILGKNSDSKKTQLNCNSSICVKCKLPLKNKNNVKSSETNVTDNKNNKNNNSSNNKIRNNIKSFKPKGSIYFSSNNYIKDNMQIHNSSNNCKDKINSITSIDSKSIIHNNNDNNDKNDNDNESKVFRNSIYVNNNCLGRERLHKGSSQSDNNLLKVNKESQDSDLDQLVKFNNNNSNTNCNNKNEYKELKYTESNDKNINSNYKSNNNNSNNNSNITNIPDNNNNNNFTCNNNEIQTENEPRNRLKTQFAVEKRLSKCTSKSPKKIIWNQSTKEAMKYKAYMNLLIERRSHICEEEEESNEQEVESDIIKKIQAQENIKKRANTIVSDVKKFMRQQPQKDAFVNAVSKIQQDAVNNKKETIVMESIIQSNMLLNDEE